MSVPSPTPTSCGSDTAGRQPRGGRVTPPCAAATDDHAHFSGLGVTFQGCDPGEVTLYQENLVQLGQQGPEPADGGARTCGWRGQNLRMTGQRRE